MLRINTAERHESDRVLTDLVRQNGMKNHFINSL